MSMEICEKAYAKLNLTLDVLGTLPDGYHEMKMVMQSVSLCDDVFVALNDSGEVTMESNFGFLPCDGRNIAVKAAQSFFAKAGLGSTGAHIRLQKRIPVGAGMAGGSTDAAAVLVSQNFQTDGYKLGDDIEIVNENGVSMIGTIYGFFEYWPTYYATDVHTDYWGESSLVEERLIVGNLVQMQNVWGVEPYEIWIKTDNTDLVYDFAAEQGLTYKTFTDTAADLVDEKNDPILQGTNGVLTVGFILVLAVCMVGFLIFWILSIRSRTLQFGVFRAMGMPMGGLIELLIAEQVCVSLTSVAAGAGVGILASRLYVPLIQLSYTSMDVTLPLRIVAEGSDYARLFSVFGAVFVICLAALAILVKRIRIAQALKLGED